VSKSLQRDLDNKNMGRKVAGFIQCYETQVMTISRKKQELKDPKFIFFDTELAETDKLKFLGVTITSSLNWSKHIDNVRAKASRKMGILRRGQRFLPKSALTTLYKSCVRSSLEYAAPVWQGAAKSHLAKLDSIQNKALKILHISEDQAIDYKIHPLKHRRDVASLCVFYRIKSGIAPSDTCSIAPSAMKQQSTTRAQQTMPIKRLRFQDQRLIITKTALYYISPDYGTDLRYM
jgi:hypothetical protein